MSQFVGERVPTGVSAAGCSMELCWIRILAGITILGAAAQTHRLQYKLTVDTQDGFVQSRFSVEGCLDHHLFLRYDSEKGRAEPLDPLPGAVRGAEPWYPETKNFTEMGKDLRMKLADIVALQSQKGVHSLQETWGCETQEDNTSRGFRRFYYDGEPFLFYDEKTHRWTAPQPSAHPLALEIKKSWDTDGFQNMDSWAHVQGELCGKVHKYLESWMTFMRRTALSTVRINCSQASEGMVTLTCWAFSFCPWNISLSWIRDDEPLSQDSQSPVCALTDENGTCQAWGVSIRVPQGKEQSFTCSLEHSWNRTLYPMTCGMVPVDQSFWPNLLLGISAVVAVPAAVAALRTLWFRRRTEPIGL